MSDGDYTRTRVGRDDQAGYRAMFASPRRGQNGRVFHLNVGPVTKAKPTGKGSSIDYLRREGIYARKHEDLVAAGGESADRMRELLQRCHDETKRKNGRVALTVVSELPRELDKDGWIEIADELSLQFEKLGYPVHWAIHNDKDGQNPHIHLVFPSRPLRDGKILAEGVSGRPCQFQRLFVGKAAVRSFRQKAAQITNNVLQRHGFEADWHGGNFRDVGVNRPAKVRVPQSAWHRGSTKMETVKTMMAVNERIDLGTRQQILVQNNRDAWWAKEKARREELNDEKEQAWLAALEAAERPLKEAKQEGWEEGYMEANNLQSDRIELLEYEKTQLEENLEAKTRELRASRKPRPVDEEPASLKQILFMQDLLKQKGETLAPNEIPVTKGTVGATIRQLQKMPDKPQEDLKAEIKRLENEKSALKNAAESWRDVAQQRELQLVAKEEALKAAYEAVRSPQSASNGASRAEGLETPNASPAAFKWPPKNKDDVMKAWAKNQKDREDFLARPKAERDAIMKRLKEIIEVADLNNIDLPGRQKPGSTLQTNHRGPHREL